ncbi:IS3 family transposase [Mesorhizobium sp. ArgA1]
MELVTIIEDIQDELPCYGYRRVTHELRRRGHLVNHKIRQQCPGLFIGRPEAPGRRVPWTAPRAPDQPASYKKIGGRGSDRPPRIF